jgi:hypothetical protein
MVMERNNSKLEARLGASKGEVGQLLTSKKASSARKDSDRRHRSPPLSFFLSPSLSRLSSRTPPFVAEGVRLGRQMDAEQGILV